MQRYRRQLARNDAFPITDVHPLQGLVQYKCLSASHFIGRCSVITDLHLATFQVVPAQLREVHRNGTRTHQGKLRRAAL
jgi:hypothetical protein